MSIDVHGDLFAEEQILGLLLLKPSRCPEVMSCLTAADFHHPLHGRSFAAIAELYQRGETVDAHSVRRLLLAQGGDDPSDRLFGWVANWSGAGIQPLIDSVQEASVRRRMRRALTDALETLDDPSRTLSEQLGAVSEAASISPATGKILGRSPFGEFEDLPDDLEPWVIPDLLRRSWRGLFVAGEGSGKMLRVDEPIPTPTGWTTMGAIHPGDWVFDGNGEPCRVTWVSPIEPNPDAWLIEFSDGSSIEADGRHQWWTVDYRARQRTHQAKVRTTDDIRETLMARGGHTVNHAIAAAGPLSPPPVTLPIDPYTLGCWLGDGNTSGGLLTLNRLDADEIQDRIDYGHRTPSGERPGSVALRLPKFSAELTALGVIGNKHIPKPYLRASIGQRKALLAGLMDTDGYIDDAADTGQGHGAACCELTFMCKLLAEGAVELIRSLGIKVTIAESNATLEGRVVGRRWRMTFQSPFNPFFIKRKGSKWFPPRTRRSNYHYIKSVTKADPSPMCCIAVDSPDHSYLASEKLIRTHNSTILRQVALCVAQGVHPFFQSKTCTPQSTLIVDLENPREAIVSTSRRIHRLCRDISPDFDRNRAHLWLRPQGLDLRSRVSFAEFDRVLTDTKPSLVTLGPLYKLYSRSARESDEQAANEVQLLLDELRARHGFALIIEHHAPQGDGGNRQMRPYGSSYWLRWPEFGFGLAPHKDRPGSLEVKRFRGDRVQARWPNRLDRGDGPHSWPWMGYWEDAFFHDEDPFL